MTAQAQETDLAARLAAWTVAQDITPADSPAALADRVIASLGPAYVAGRLDSGATEYLRGAAERYADPGRLSDGQWAIEEHYHGHGGKPPKGRRGNG